jgi:hypothetical protein
MSSDSDSVPQDKTNDFVSSTALNSLISLQSVTSSVILISRVARSNAEVLLAPVNSNVR